VTRTLLGATSVVTLGSQIKLINPYNVAWIEAAVFGKFQLWRPFTCFFLGPGGISFLFTCVEARVVEQN
jgi:Derlin-2/3